MPLHASLVPQRHPPAEQLLAEFGLQILHTAPPMPQESILLPCRQTLS